MAKFIQSHSCVDCNCKNSIFSALSSAELELINSNRFEVSFKAGEMMFKQGTPSPHFRCLTTGLAKLYIEGYGKNLILSLVKPVEYILGPGIFVDNRHHYSASAVEDSTACLVDVITFKKMIRNNPDFADEFIRGLKELYPKKKIKKKIKKINGYIYVNRLLFFGGHLDSQIRNLLA